MTNIPGLKKCGAFWHYSIQVNGHRAHGSTKATDLATARMVMEEKRRAILHGQLDISKAAIPNLNSIWESWWKAHHATFSTGHLVSAECRYRRWIRPSLGLKRADQLTADLVLSLRNYQLEQGCSSRYANNTSELLRTLLRYAVNVGQLDRVPFVVKPIRIQKRPRPTVPGSKVVDFIQASERISKNTQVGVMLKTMIGLGLREAELLGMRREWLDFEQECYVVGRAKNKLPRVIPIPSWLLSALSPYSQATGEWVFPARDGKPHRSGFLRKALRRIAIDLDLGTVSQHRLRASFASLHAEAGTPITEIQGMLGHQTLQSTLIYIEPSMKARRDAQNALGQRLGLL